jgi:hypothetical protein
VSPACAREGAPADPVGIVNWLPSKFRFASPFNAVAEVAVTNLLSTPLVNAVIVPAASTALIVTGKQI